MIEKSKTIPLKALLSGETKRLVEELYTAQRILMPEEQSMPGQDPTYFVVAKLVSHLNKKAWNELCALTRPTSYDFFSAECFEQKGAVHLSLLKEVSPSPEWMHHLFLSASFLQQLKEEVSRAKRGGAPLALVRFAIEQHNSFTFEHITRILYDVIEKCGDDCDTLSILDTKNFALILPGAKSFKALSIVEDILDECRHNALSLCAGIAAHTGAECNIQNFLEHAATALEQALTQKVALFIHRKPHESLEAKRTLVQGHEKRFLFGPIDEV